MADASITVLMHQEATDVTVTRVTDFLEGTVKVYIILCVAVELAKSNENGTIVYLTSNCKQFATHEFSWYELQMRPIQIYMG